MSLITELNDDILFTIIDDLNYYDIFALSETNKYFHKFIKINHKYFNKLLKVNYVKEINKITSVYKDIKLSFRIYEDTIDTSAINNILNIKHLDSSQNYINQNTTFIESINNFSNIDTLIMNAKFIENINKIELYNLEKLVLMNCETLDLSQIKKFTKLKDLVISQLYSNNLDFLENSYNLESLEIDYSRIKKYNLNNCVNLKNLKIYYNEDKPTIIYSLYNCKKLKTLYLGAIDNIKSLYFLNNCVELENITLHRCRCLETLHGLNSSNLISVELDQCSFLKDINLLYNSKNLKKLTISHNNYIKNVNFKNIDNLTLIYCFGIRKISSNPKCLKIFGKNITLPNNKNFKNNIVELYIHDNLKIKKIKHYPNLKWLSLYDCNVKKINNLNKLEMIYIKSCPNLKKLNLKTIDSIELFTLRGLTRLLINENIHYIKLSYVDKLKFVEFNNNLISLPNK